MVDVPAACSALLVCLSGSGRQARQILEQHGIWLDLSYDATEARQRLRRSRPDVLIIGLSGDRNQDWDTCQELTGVFSIFCLLLQLLQPYAAQVNPTVAVGRRRVNKR